MQCVFLFSFDLCFLFPLFISPRFDLNSVGSFFASARLISPSLILSKRLTALLNSVNFASVVEPLCFYIKSLGLTFFYLT